MSTYSLDQARSHLDTVESMLTQLRARHNALSVELQQAIAQRRRLRRLLLSLLSTSSQHSDQSSGDQLSEQSPSSSPPKAATMPSAPSAETELHHRCETDEDRALASALESALRSARVFNSVLSGGSTSRTSSSTPSTSSSASSANLTTATRTNTTTTPRKHSPVKNHDLSRSHSSVSNWMIVPQAWLFMLAVLLSLAVVLSFLEMTPALKTPCM